MKKNLKYISTLTIIAALGVFGFSIIREGHTSGLTGADFDAGRIIDDGVFFNSGSMNTGDIQNFLNAKVPTCDTNGAQPSGRAGYPTRADWGRANGAPPPYICLKDYSQSIPSTTADTYCGAITGGTKSAADIIFNVARACSINPQSLIVLLQKEQSLISDDWPWPIQYRSATGYGCPDTAACDAQYYGYFNQVYNAAHQFRRYIQQPQSFNYAIGRNSYILYNPNASCGGSNITIQTQATAALYNYTPYQPNQSALNNLYGSGDACGAYGNRNFWRMFNDWFGPTKIDSFTLAIGDNGNPSQYVIFGGIKQAIPDPETKVAWGLQNIPLITMSSSYLASIPNGPYLDRLTRLNTSDQTVFFMDGGKRYRVTSQAMFDAWNLGGRPISSVPPGLFYVPADGGELRYSVKDPASSTLYMPDGANGSGQTVLRQYQTDQVFAAWEGDGAPFTSISTEFFNQMDNAVGSPLTTTKMLFGATEYQVASGRKKFQSGAIAPLYPGTAQAISSSTFSRLAPDANMTYLVRSSSAPEVYLIDNGTKHHIQWPDLLTAWTVSGFYVSTVNNSYLSLLPTGSPITGYIAENSGQRYLVDGAKMPVPASLQSAYGSIGAVYSASSTLLQLFKTTPNQTSGFIKGRSTPQVYLLDNSGKKRHIEWEDKLSLYGGQPYVLPLSDYIVNSIGSAQSPQIYVGDGTGEYVIEGGNKLPVDSTARTDWGLVTPQIYSDGTLSRFPTGSALTNSLQGSGGYFLVKGGSAYGTADRNIAEMWGINNAPTRNPRLISNLVRQFMLTRFIKSSTDGRIFIVDNGQWYNLTPQQRANLGSSSEPTMQLNPGLAPNAITDWSSAVVRVANGISATYVIDGGGKRTFGHQMIYDQWTTYGTITIPTVTNGFVNLLPTKGGVQRAIKGTGPSVYSAEGGTKRHILYPDTFNRYYAPFQTVSDELLNVMPTGTPIN